MPTIGNTPRPGYVYDQETDTWIPIGVGPHTHSYVDLTLIDAKGDLLVGSSADTVSKLSVGNSGETLVADSSATTGLRWQGLQSAGRNKFINGDMAISQRGTSAISVPSTNTTTYGVDRWFGLNNGGGVTSITQSTTAPAGFGYSSLLTVTTADSSIAAGDYYLFGQRIEGFNSADFAFGTSSAKTLTLSFWIRSTLTGTFSVCVSSSDEGRWFVNTYTINSANTWEYKTITITGDTTGTWNKDNSTGMAVYFTLGNGSTFDATAGTWNASTKFGTSSSVDFIGTLNATMNITGVQIEASSVATPFTRAMGTLAGELAACQRYYFRNTGGQAYSHVAFGMSASTTAAKYDIICPVQLRAVPTSIEWGNLAVNQPGGGGGGGAPSSITLNTAESSLVSVNIDVSKTGLTAFIPYYLVNNNNTAGFIAVSSEL